MRKLKLCFILFILTTMPQLLFSQLLHEKLEEVAIKNQLVGCSVVLFSGNTITDSFYFGKSDLDRDISITAETKYRIASISKSITAIAIMQLVEKGFLKLDQDISEILGYKVQHPLFPKVKITCRMLLSHTSGFVDGSTYDDFLQATVFNPVIPDLREVLQPDGSFYNSSYFSNYLPGSYFNYSNLNFIVLGTIVEKVSKLRFDQYCRRYIFQPLGIDASYNVTDIRDINTVAVLYRNIDGKWTPQTDNYSGKAPVLSNLSEYCPGTNAGKFGPQGGLRCSAADLAKIYMRLMNMNNTSDLLKPITIKKMFSPQWSFNGENGDFYHGLFRSWGLGIHLITSTPGNDVVLKSSKKMVGHSGDAYGLASSAYFDPKRKIGFVFITNGAANLHFGDTSAFYTVEEEMFDAIDKYGNLYPGR